MTEMVKKQKKFSDDYDLIFLEPSYEEVEKKIEKVELEIDVPKKNKKVRNFILITVAIFSCIVVYSLKKNSEEAAKYAEYEDIYPLKNSGLRQADESDIDKTKTIHTKLDDNKLIVNKEYQFEIQGKVEINSKAKNEWMLIPTLENDPEKQSMFEIDLYEDSYLMDSFNFYLYSNLINGFSVYFDPKNGSDTKVFKEADFDNIQNGYVLEHKVNVGEYMQNSIYKYYIFSDGTGILYSMALDYRYDIKEEKISDLTLDDFKKKFKEDLDLLESTIVFSKL